MPFNKEQQKVYVAQHYIDNKEIYINRAHNWRLKNSLSRILIGAKQRATQEDLEYTISKKDVKLPTHCPVFGIELRHNKGRARDNSYALDRIDNTKGYIPKNIKIISHRANRLKSDMSLEDIEKLYKYVKENWPS